MNQWEGRENNFWKNFESEDWPGEKAEGRMPWDDAGRTMFEEKLSWRVGRGVERPR